VLEGSAERGSLRGEPTFGRADPDARETLAFFERGAEVAARGKARGGFAPSGPEWGLALAALER
jgi:hypothetical protein